MNVNKLIITTIFSIAILGLIGCKKEHDKPVTHIPPYESGNKEPESIHQVHDLPKEAEEALNRLGIKVGLIPIVDHESGDIFIFKGRDIELKDLKFPISTRKIESITPITIFSYEGSKCSGVTLGGGSGQGGCSKPKH